jgi:hypothetical protein
VIHIEKRNSRFKNRRAATRQAILIGVCFVFAAPAAHAGDWSAKARLNQNVEASDNRALAPDSAGATYLFTTRARLDAITVSPTMSLEFNADLSYQNLTGPGADQNSSPTDNSLGFKLDNKLDNITSYNLGGYWQRQDATTAQLADTGIVIVTGDINTYVLEGGVNRKLNPWDELRWSARGTVVDFSSAPGTSFTDWLMTAAWVTQATKSTQLATSLQLEVVQQDDPANTEAVIGRLQTGFETAFTHDLSVKGSVGAGLQRTSQDTNAFGTGPSESDMSANALADARIIYLPMQSAQLILSASHWTGPNVLGQIETRTILGAAWLQAINHLSNLALRTEYTGQLPVVDLFDDGNTGYLRASVDYDYRLSPEWVAQLSYRFAHRNDDVGSANSNTLFFSAVYESTILP